jgi:hypothetical protein
VAEIMAKAGLDVSRTAGILDIVERLETLSVVEPEA